MQTKLPPRRVSRCLAFQVLYGQEFNTSSSSAELRKAFLAAPRQDGADMEEADGDAADAGQGEPAGFAWELVQGVWRKASDLDEIIARFARNWRLERVGRVELTLLRLAIYEMLYRPDVPPKVAMNEALELDRQFGEEKSRSFVNGILDAVAKAMEKGELRRAVD